MCGEWGCEGWGDPQIPEVSDSCLSTGVQSVLTSPTSGFWAMGTPVPGQTGAKRGR